MQSRNRVQSLHIACPPSPRVLLISLGPLFQTRYLSNWKGPAKAPPSSLGNYSQRDIVTSMLDTLQWPPLSTPISTRQSITFRPSKSQIMSYLPLATQEDTISPRFKWKPTMNTTETASYQRLLENGMCPPPPPHTHPGPGARLICRLLPGTSTDLHGLDNSPSSCF